MSETLSSERVQETATGSRRSSSRLLAVIAATSMLAGGAGWWLSGFVRSPAQVAAETAAPEPTLLTAAVERRSLYEAVVTVGTVEPEQVVEIGPGGSGSGPAVVTALPVSAGQEVSEGSVVVELSGRPTFVLLGPVPAYRDLVPSSRGKDVRQLQANLIRLGYDLEADGVFGPQTEQAVRQMYESAGYEPVPTAPDDDVRIEAATDRVRDAQRALDDARRALAQAQQEPDADTHGPRSAVASAEQALARAVRDLGRLRRTTGFTLPLSEVVVVPSGPATVIETRAEVGDRPQDVVLTLASGQATITAQLTAAERRLLEVGDEVVVTLTSGDELAAKVAAFGSASAPDGTSSSAAQVRIATDPALPAARVGQDVKLSIVSSKTGQNTLVVPVTAIVSQTDGRHLVRRVVEGEPDGTIEVRLGDTAGGFVEIEPVAGDLKPGDHVQIGPS